MNHVIPTSSQDALSDKEAWQARVLQARKLEAVGQLAGSVAHDFNNLLTVILGYSEIGLSQLPPNNEVRRFLDEVYNAGLKARALVQQLLNFSRQQALQLQTLSLNEVIQDIESMLRSLVREDIDLVLSLDPAANGIVGDRTQIQQILINLVVNAVDAMPEGGMLTIGTGKALVEPEHPAAQQGLPPGDYAMLYVTDTGQGIDAKTLKRIFEPFFTTKEPGKGTGLGLATVKTIIDQHGGAIVVESEPGVGATFQVYLPRVEQAEAGLAAQQEHWRARQGHETILIVEDNDEVRELTRDMLMAFGYCVLEAADPASAIDLAQAQDRPIHLLLTDVIMPGMDGWKLYEKLQAIHPEMRALFMSGHPAEVVMERGIPHDAASFIQKPFTAQTLTRKIGEALAMAAD